MLIVAGRIPVRPERRADAVAAAVKMMRATQAETGCRTYRFTTDVEDPNLFYIFEEWEDDAALTAHFQTPHMASFQAALPDFLAGAPTLKRYEVASAGAF